MVVAGLALAVLGGVVVALSPGGLLSAGLIAVLGFALFVLLLATRVVTPIDLLVIGAPFMSNLPLTGPLHLAASDAIVPLAVLQMLIQYRRADPSDRLQRRHVAYLLTLFVAICVSSIGGLLFSRGYSFVEALIDGMKLLVGFGYLGVIVFELHKNGLPSLLRLLKIWSWTAVGLAIASLLTAVRVATIVPSDGYRSYGFFGDPNLFGGYLILSLTLVLARTSLAYYRLWLLHAVILTAGVITTGSRGSMLTVAVVLTAGIVFIRRFNTRVSILAIGVSLALAVRILVSQGSNSVIMGASRLMTATEHVGTDPRLQLWNKAIELWGSSPLTGIGLGQFETYSAHLYGFYANGRGYVAHNSFLSFGVETGVIGLGLILFALGWMARRLLSYRGPYRDVRTALLLGLLGIVLTMMTINLQNLRYVWIFFGIAIAFPRIAAVTVPDPAEPAVARRGVRRTPGGGPSGRRTPALRSLPPR